MVGCEIDAGGLGIEGRLAETVRIAHRCSAEGVFMHHHRAESSRKLDGARLQRLGRSAMDVDPVLQPPAQTSAVVIDQHIDMGDEVVGDGGRDHLGDVPAPVAGKDLVQIRLAVLLRRLTVEGRRRQGIGDRDGADPAGKLADIDLVEQAAHHHRGQGLVTMDRADDPERRAIGGACEDMEGQRKRSRKRPGHVKHGEEPVLAASPWRCIRHGSETPGKRVGQTAGLH
jgi:hypothetical protein